MYGNAELFLEYHEARGRVAPGTWTTESITAALLVASEWVDYVYGPSFIGYKKEYLQTNEWPRIGATVVGNPSYTYAEFCNVHRRSE